MFKVVRLYHDAGGDSHFSDMYIPLHDAGDIGRLSETFAASGIIFREVSAMYDYAFHTAPQRQFIILLDGSIEIETSLGVKRIFGGGDILLVEDTEGKGHRTKNITQAIRKSIFITLPYYSSVAENVQ